MGNRGQGVVGQCAAGGLLLPPAMAVAWHGMALGDNMVGSCDLCLRWQGGWSDVRMQLVAAGNRDITMTRLVGSLCFWPMCTVSTGKV